jgi:8-oxo-dGTP pyrophosphatase MutT (NUDIX family)
MKILGEKRIYKGKFIEVLKRKFLTKERKKGDWEMIKRKDGVMIFALTKKKEVILEKIYRVPLKSFSLELPAGMLDKKGESKKEAAKRELLEETGYLAKKMIFVKSFPFNPSLEKTQLSLFFAPNVEYFGKKKSEDVEEIEVIKIPLKNFLNFLFKPPKKTKVDLAIFGILLLLAKKGLI